MYATLSPPSVRRLYTHHGIVSPANKSTTQANYHDEWKTCLLLQRLNCQMKQYIIHLNETVSRRFTRIRLRHENL